jgi:hypothetical protein
MPCWLCVYTMTLTSSYIEITWNLNETLKTLFPTLLCLTLSRFRTLTVAGTLQILTHPAIGYTVNHEFSGCWNHKTAQGKSDANQVPKRSYRI